MPTTIQAPDAANLPGEYRTRFGSTEVLFVDGKAEVDELPDSVRAYLALAGYTVDGKTPKGSEPDPAPVVDARDATGELVGTPLRDAAVDPRPEDFLPPVNAGEADPHGPLVVAPGIHAEGERVVAAGPVSSDPDTQSAKEQRLAEKLLVDNEQVGVPNGADWKDGTGPLGLSDPLSAEQGVEDAKAGLAADAGRDKLDGEPSGNAGRDEWVAFARTQGAPDDELGEDGLGRNELRAKYGS